jgi:hypothetical protein
MSDVVLSTTESVTTVTVVDDVVQVAVTTNPVEVSSSTAGVQGASYAKGDPIYVTVTNKTGATLPKGSIVYTSGANGTHTQVSLALATSDATSARALGWLSESIANNADGLCMVEGYLDGVDTQGVTEGAQLYLSGTVPGGFQQTKPVAPIHLVYVGVAAKASAGNGRVYVKVQNGYELGELHDVLITSPANNQVLAYDSATQLWKNAVNAPDGVTSITAVAPLTGGTITSTGSIGLDQTALSITRSQVSDFTSGTVTSASTAQQAGTAVYSVNSGTAVYSTTSGTAVTISGDITKSQVSDFTSGTVASASTAQQSGTATFATTSGTATYATNSGTAVFATNAGTAVGVSGSAITQSQVVNLVSDLANTAKLNTANTFSVGGHVINNGATGTVPIRVNAIAGQTANQMEFYNASGVLSSRIAADGAYVAGANSESFISGASFRLQITPASAATVAATIRGASGQSANLQVWTDNSNSVLAQVTSGGSIQSAGNLTAGTLTALARLTVLNGAVGTIGAVIRGVASQTANLLELQSSAGSVLAGVSASGEILSNGSKWVQDASGFRIQNSAGTGLFRATTANAFTDGQTSYFFQIGNASGNNGILQSAGGNVLGRLLLNSPNVVIDSTGFASVPVPTGAFEVRVNTASQVGQIIRGAASQTGDLTQWQSSAGTVLSEITSTGSFYVNTNNNTSGIEFLGGSGTQVIYANGNDLSIRPRFDLLFSPADSSGRLRPSNDNTSDLGTTGQRWRTVHSSGLFVNNSTVGNVVSTIRAASGQTANLTEWQDNSGNTLTRINNTGIIITNTKLIVGATTGILGTSSLYANDASTIALAVRGAASQTANLQEWQNSAGAVMARVEPNGGAWFGSGNVTITGAGVLRAVTLATIADLGRLGDRNSGSELTLTRQNAVSTNPGANLGRLYFRDGTNAGTLKLVVRAGAAGAETTILDNIPQ